MEVTEDTHQMQAYGTVHRKRYDNYVCRLTLVADSSQFIREKVSVNT